MKKLLLSSALVSSFALCAPALAQDNDASAEETNTGRDVVVVTATKREQSIQDVPGALTAVSGDQLDARGISDPTDLGKIVPNLTTDVWNGDVNLTLRGIGKTVNGAPGGVALHLDGAFQPRTTMVNLVQTDMERVEVLRGPQGTIYGRNANGGVVNYITKSGGDEFGGFIQGSYSNYDEYRVAGAVDLPLGDNIRTRLTAAHSMRNQGFVENILGGQDLDDGSNTMARLRIDADITDDLDVSLIGTFGEQDGSYVYFVGLGAPSPLGISLNPQYAGATLATGPRQSTLNDLVDGFKRIKAVTGIINWKLSEGLSIKSITAYQTFDFDFVGDFDGSEFSIAVPDRREASETFTQELNLVFETGPVSGVLGGFYMDDDFDQAIDFAFPTGAGQLPAPGAPVRPPLPPGSGTGFDNMFGTQSYAVFGDVTLNLTDRFRLFGGLRYSEDKASITQNNAVFAGTPGGPVVIPPSVCIGTSEVTFSSTTPRAGLQYDVSDNSGLYASYSQGFKSGGFAFTGCQATYDSETVKAYEIGSKNTFADGALILNASAFYYDYTNLQVQQLVGLAFSTQNAPEARVFGVEVETIFQPNDYWTFDGNLGFQDAEFVEFMNGDILNGAAGLQDLNGNPLTFSPDVSANLGIAYQSDPVIAGGAITLRTNLSYKSRVYFREFGVEADSQGAYALLDASIQWDSANEDYSVRIFGRNLTGEDYFTGVLSAALTGARIARYGEPLRYGIELRANF